MIENLPTPSFESGDALEIPPRPVREVALEAISDIDRTIEVLRAWGVKIGAHSRLHKARDILEYAVDTNVLVPRHRGDHLGLRALEVAFDFAAIADTLPLVPLAALRRDLRDSLAGEIEPPESARGPLQLQSQEIVNAAFVRGGLSPIRPTHSSRRGLSTPDLVLENGNLRYAIEAKRPQVLKNVGERFEEGCKQLSNYGLPGGVMMDVTDCLRHVAQPMLLGEVRRIALTLYNRVFVTGRGHRPGYAHIVAAGAYARLSWSSDDGDKSAMVNVHTSSVIGIFATARNTLGDLRARWIRDRFQDGLWQLGLTLAETRPSNTG